MPRKEGMPKFLVKESRQEKPFPWGEPGEARTLQHWLVVMDEEELKELLLHAERPGFGTDYDAITYQVFTVALESHTFNRIAPITMEEAALPLVKYDYSGCTLLGPGLKVEIGLRGSGHDPKTVFWDSKGNSFAIVKPPQGANGLLRGLVSDQKVMLLSINGIGEIRWDVTRSSCLYPENVEATKHFDLSWGKV